MLPRPKTSGDSGAGVNRECNPATDQKLTVERATRVLHVTYDMGIGGTEQVICQLIDGLDPDKYVCEVACLERQVGPLGERLQADGVEFHTLNRVPGFDRSLVRKLRDIYRSNSIDIVHCHQYTPYVYGVLAAMFTRVKVVFTEHGRHYPDRFSWKRRLVNPVLSTRTAKIVAISAATADALSHFEWFCRGGISVVYNGMAPGQRDLHRRKRRAHGIGDEKLVYGTISRFDAVKNLPLLVKAFAQVRSSNPDVVLLLVGDGEERPAIEQLVRELAVEQAVVFCGYQTDTAAYMSAIDVFLLPSLSEGTSMTLLEAMSMSVCCIVTDVGGNPEIVERDETGLVVPNADLQALVEAMSTVADDTSIRGELARKGCERFNDKFTLTNMIDQYQRLYQSLVS